MIFPAFAFVLAGTGQIEVGSEQGSQVRFFMVDEDDANGIGVQVKRPSSGENQCYQNNLVYLLWEGGATGQNSSFCTCYDRETNASLPVEASSCRP